MFFKEVLKDVICEVFEIGVMHMMKSDGKWDKRFGGEKDHPTKKDGTLDMRYKCNWGIRK